MNIFGTSGRATDFFAPPTYREGQKEMIEQIELAFSSGKRFIVFEGPTGSGKSQIARAFAFQANSTYIMTPLKILQTQYERDFPEMKIVKGRNAYRCLAPKGSTCDKGPCRIIKNYGHPDCPYQEARKQGLVAPVTIYNFDSFFYQNLYLSNEEREKRRRKLMILDEAHAIESKYLGFMRLIISNKNQNFHIPEYQEIGEYDQFVRNQLLTCDERIAQLEEEFKTLGTRSELDAFQLEHLRKLKFKLETYVANREGENPLEYVFKFENRGDYQKITFEPIFVRQFITQNLFPYAERFLLMSATILDHGIFCRNIGLDPNEVAFLQQENNFPAKHRPIVKQYVGKLSFRYINETLPKITDAIEEILKRHPDKKGIIQTHSEKIATYIKLNLDNPRLTFNKDSHTPQEMLEIHKKKPGSFIVASGLREGLDLKGDLSEVQIFCKTPFPNLGDRRVQRRKDLQPGWYSYQTALMFIQALGRSVRSEKEKAITYILDKSFERFYLNHKKLFPSYIRETIEVIQRTP